MRLVRTATSTLTQLLNYETVFTDISLFISLHGVTNNASGWMKVRMARMS